jgi:hypothetical protein
VKRSSRSRTTAELSKSLNHQLNMYALAAGAAGVGFLALAQPSEAKIVYTPAHRTIHLHRLCHIDLNRDGLVDFTVQMTRTGASTFGYISSLRILASSSQKKVAGRLGAGGLSYAYALRRGSFVGSNQPFSGNLMAEIGSTDGSFFYRGAWLGLKKANRYLGLKIQVQGRTHYGWARFSVVNTKRAIVSASLTGYAYETIPNKPIVAGKTKGPDVTTVAPTSLGHLAAGASAIPAWRSGR